MKTYQGILRKMKTELKNPVQYKLSVGTEMIPLNHCLNRPIEMVFSGHLFCIQCERKTNKSFQQGFCYPCYRRLLECNLCVIHPERCRVATGSCSTNDWAHAQCHSSHVIYLANASGLKIGITRESQVPFRWMDQGAVQALPIIKVNNRYQAGIVEVAFKKLVSDKTNWRVMLKNEVVPLDLPTLRDELLHQVKFQFNSLDKDFLGEMEFLKEDPVVIDYPVLHYPKKIASLSFDKTKRIVGTLLGIKGQYLLLEQGVINLRKFSGYDVAITLPSTTPLS